MRVPLTPLRFLRYAREQFPNKLGVVCDDEHFTYAEFADRAFRLAGALQAAGAKAGDRIAFLSTNCHRLLEAYYGVPEAGCVLLPLNIRLAPQELAFVLNDAEPRFLFFEPSFLPLVEGIRSSAACIQRYFLLDGGARQSWIEGRNYDEIVRESPPLQCDWTQIDEDSVAELFYTSGSSDRPKGVILTHRNIYLHALSIIAAGQTSAATVGEMACTAVLLHTIPLFHANGWGTAHAITLVGGTHVMIHQFSSVEVFRLIERERVSTCAMVPAMAAALANSPEKQKYDLSSLQSITIGGAASSPALVKAVVEKLGCACISGYGLTETCPTLTKSPRKVGVLWDGPDLRYAGQAMTGYAIPGVELKVVGRDGGEVPHDGSAMGEILVRGDGVMEGYWGQPEATQQSMEGGWFHTGDIATINADQYVQIVDRKKDIIVSGGENISSLEVEKVLSAHPGVHETAVIPVPDEKWGEVPKALVVLKAGTQATEQELLEFCRRWLSHYKCPRSVEFVSSLPKTGSGKILKQDLRRQYSSAEKTAEKSAAS